MAELDGATLRRARAETPLRRDEKPWILARELSRHLNANDENWMETDDAS